MQLYFPWSQVPTRYRMLVLGGLIVQTLGWRAIFWINLPIALVALLLVLVRAPGQTRTPTNERVDGIGAVLLAGAVLSLVFGVSRVGVDGWTGGIPVAGLSVGCVLLAVLARSNAPRPTP